jgi:hypothetical protein
MKISSKRDPLGLQVTPGYASIGTAQFHKAAGEITATVTTGFDARARRGTNSIKRPGAGSNNAADLEPVKSRSVVLHGVIESLEADIGQAFIVDCCRHTEGLLCDADLRAKWALSDEHWSDLANNVPLLEAVRAGRERRIENGDAAREAAQRHFADAPTVLGEILKDELVSPRHRIEAAKELRQVAGNGPENHPGSGEKFTITIDLGGDDKLIYETEHAPGRPLQGESS